MMTSDYSLTAESIARQIGIVLPTNQSLGHHRRPAQNKAKADLKQALRPPDNLRRMAPEQKYDVVTTLQETGEVVAVTGDGSTMPRPSRRPTSGSPWVQPGPMWPSKLPR
ncbi:hypothetical protein [Limosilactobacillus fermentum]